MHIGKLESITFSIVAAGLFLAGLLLLTGTQVARADPGDPLFVSATGSGSDCSQATPCALQTALGLANDGDTIRVSQGVYSATVKITKSLTLEGGWNGNFTARDWDTYVTTIDAHRNGSVIQVHGHVTTTIEGFVITGGDGSDYLGWGGGIEAYGNVTAGKVVVTITHNVISDNIACHSSGCQGEGGGIRVGIGTAFIAYNTVVSNVANTSSGNGGQGGGVMIGWSGEATLTGNTILSNTAAYTLTGYARGQGGGVYVYSADGILRDNEIRGNVAAVDGAGRGGGVYAGGALYNNRILSNTATISGTGHGGGVYALYVTNFDDNTIQGNVRGEFAEGKGLK